MVKSGYFFVSNEYYENCECVWNENGTFTVTYGDCFESFTKQYDSANELFAEWNVDER